MRFVDLVEIECGKCGVYFGLPRYKQKELQETHETFYCPNGHARVYHGKTPEEKRIEELELQVKRLTSERDRLRDHRECPIAGCAWYGFSSASFSKHLRRAHGATNEPPRKRLPADAGEDCYGSGAPS